MLSRVVAVKVGALVGTRTRRDSPDAHALSQMRWPEIRRLDTFQNEKHIEWVNVISRQGLLNMIEDYPDAQNWIQAWLLVAKQAIWTSLADVRQTYPHTDQVGQCLIFDVKGNNYRLIATVIWARKVLGSSPPKTVNGALYIKHFLTHADYDKDAWKGCC